MSTSGNFPNPSSPLVGADGRMSPEWFGFFLALFNRTGGSGTPTDLTALQKQVNAQGLEIADLFEEENASATATMVGALVSKIAYIERAIASTVLPPHRANQEIPAPSPVATQCATKPEMPGPVYAPFANYLLSAKSLGDIQSASAARTNLGLGTAAVQNVSYFAQAANNLSDLANVTTARSNLGLGSIATQAASNVALTGGNVDGVSVGQNAPILNFTNTGTITTQRFGSAGAVIVRTAGGTQASPSVISASSSIALVTARGYDGANYQNVGWINFISDGAISSSSSPGYVTINTTPSGSVSPAERIRVNSAGRVLVNQASDDGTTTMQINGSLSVSSSTLIKTNTSLTNGAAAATGTLANAPIAGNPTKWIPINDNGTTRYIPAW